MNSSFTAKKKVCCEVTVTFDHWEFILESKWMFVPNLKNSLQVILIFHIHRHKNLKHITVAALEKVQQAKCLLMSQDFN